ncbi:PAS domain S-box protein [Parapedobacter deserti]|uniref:histidine kinase n=1 Tax=Parapedobacter deserti TaxID=1912957 RepID=A0ABV7JTG5_9SPHI
MTNKLGMQRQSLRWLTDDSPIAMYTCDGDGYITDYNGAATHLWGRKPTIGKDTWCGAWKSYSRDGSIMEWWECPMAKVIKSKTAIDREEMIIEQPDGNRRRVLVYPKPFFEGNTVIGAGAYLVDVTSKDETETRHAFLSSVVESSDDAIITKNLNGVITSWNKGAEQIFGYTEHEVLGKPITILIPDERIQEEAHILSQIRIGKKVDHFRTVRINKHGEELFISLTVSPVKDNSGRIVGASKIARDITKQAKAETAIRLYASNLEAINSISRSIAEKLEVTKIMQYVADVTTGLTGAAFGCFFYETDTKTADGDSTLLYTVSGGDETLPGWVDGISLRPARNDEAIMTPPFIINIKNIGSEPASPLAIDYRISLMQRANMASYLQIPVISSNGTVVGELFFGHPQQAAFDDRHEELVSSIASHAAIALDNSKLFEEVKALNKKKDEFIGLASHELKTPLTSISGFLQIIQKKANNPHTAKFIHKAITEVVKLNKLVSDLLDVTRVENGKLPFQMEAFDCKMLLFDMLETFQHTYPDRSMHYYDTVNDAMVCADRQRIEQVLINLLDNAVKYSPQSKNVYVSLSNIGEYIKISVRDEGIGMTEMQQKGLFTRFYRVESTPTKVPGLGLGLYLSKEIITSHSGELACKSEPGKGSEFYFTLPHLNSQIVKHSIKFYEKAGCGT